MTSNVTFEKSTKITAVNYSVTNLNIEQLQIIHSFWKNLLGPFDFKKNDVIALYTTKNAKHMVSIEGEYLWIGQILEVNIFVKMFSNCLSVGQ